MQSHKLLYGLSLLAFSTSLHAGYNEGVDAYQKKDYASAMAEWKPVAEKGDLDAQYNVGAMYSHALGRYLLVATGISMLFGAWVMKRLTVLKY